MSTRRCPAVQAFRMRVSMSATGSVRLIPSPSPAGLAHTGDLAPERELAETDAAQSEPAQHGPAAPAALAAPHGPHLELGRALRPLDPTGLGHVPSLLPLSSEQRAVSSEQDTGLPPAA